MMRMRAESVSLSSDLNVSTRAPLTTREPSHNNNPCGNETPWSLDRVALRNALAKTNEVDYSGEMQDLAQGSVPVDVVHRIHHKFWTYLLFWSIVAGSVIAVPGYGLIYGYSWLDWTMFAVLYVITGLGITVGTIAY